MGSNVKILENKLKKLVGTKYCITCSSGTDALLMSLMAMNIKKNDIIFTSVYSYISTAEVIKLLGATPVFVDVDSETFNIDPSKLNTAIKATKLKNKKIYPLPKEVVGNKNKFNLKGIISPNLFGNPADYLNIKKIAKKNKLFIIEDAAQSLGAKLNNKFSGSFGDIGCTSFYPTKTLGAYGDGGAIFTNNSKIYKNLISIRVHGQTHKSGYFDRLGLTGRLDTLQASILLVKLKYFLNEIKLRKKISMNYKKLLADCKQVELPKNYKKSFSVWSLFTIKLLSEKIRDKVINNLKKNQISYGIYYKYPFHLQKVFSDYGYKKKDFPIAEKLSKTSISIPMDPYLNNNEIFKITKVIRRAVEK